MPTLFVLSASCCIDLETAENRPVNPSCGESAEEEDDLGGPEGHVYVGDLQWWTTDADLEQECRRFGRVREIKFFEDNLNGKSKGAAKITFSRQEAAAACLAQMNGCALSAGCEHCLHG